MLISIQLPACVSNLIGPIIKFLKYLKPFPAPIIAQHPGRSQLGRANHAPGAWSRENAAGGRAGGGWIAHKLHFLTKNYFRLLLPGATEPGGAAEPPGLAGARVAAWGARGTPQWPRGPQACPHPGLWPPALFPHPQQSPFPHPCPAWPPPICCSPGRGRGGTRWSWEPSCRAGAWQSQEKLFSCSGAGKLIPGDTGEMSHHL